MLIKYLFSQVSSSYSIRLFEGVTGSQAISYGALQRIEFVGHKGAEYTETGNQFVQRLREKNEPDHNWTQKRSEMTNYLYTYPYQGEIDCNFLLLHTACVGVRQPLPCVPAPEVNCFPESSCIHF